MDNIRIEATERSPEIGFDFETNVFSIRGESYPEDVVEFYGPILQTLETHLGALQDTTVQFNFELIYFNSSTAKVLMSLFDMLDNAAETNSVTIYWKYEADDDNMHEMGEEYGEDLTCAQFQLVEV